jgi:dCTP deaminase
MKKEGILNPNVFGTLPDNIIRNYVERKMLIVENFDQKYLKQACYELRSSNLYFDLSNKNKRYTIEGDNYILLKPKQIIVIITYERLDLPTDIIGRIVTKGSLFSIGILPVNTYADPGFRGKLGIVLNNASNNYIKIKVFQPIAKIEFSKLQQKVDNPYSGQHGFETEVWPIKDEYILTDDERKKDTRIGDIIDEISLSYGKDIGIIIKRVLVLERKMIITSIIYFIFNFLLLGISIFLIKDAEKILYPLLAVLMGLGSNILFAILTNLIRSRGGSGK